MSSTPRTPRAYATAFALFSLITTPLSGSTQELGTRAPLIAESPGSPSALVLGGAAEMASGTHSAIFHNVGALRSTGGAGVWFHSFGGHATILGISTGTNVFGGAMAVGLRQMSHRGGGTGLEALPGDEGGYLSDGQVGLSSVEATVGFSRRVPFGLRIGVAAKLLEQSINGARVSRAALDIGATRRVGPATVGLTARNIGNNLDFGDVEAPLPLEFGAGAALPRRIVGPLDIGAAINLVYRDDEELLPSGGIEVAYWPIQGRTFVGRIGYTDSPTGPAQSMVMGGAIEWDSWVLDYGWRPYRSARDSHQVGISWGG